MARARQRARRGDSMTSRQPIGAPRNAPSDATAERALLFAPAVRRCSVGPHAWSRARVNRLAPRKEPKPSGEGSPFITALRAGVVLSHPKKLVCWGPGSALAVCRFSSIQISMGPRTSALNSRHWNPTPPLRDSSCYFMVLTPPQTRTKGQQDTLIITPRTVRAGDPLRATRGCLRSR